MEWLEKYLKTFHVDFPLEEKLELVNRILEHETARDAIRQKLYE